MMRGRAYSPNHGAAGGPLQSSDVALNHLREVMLAIDELSQGIVITDPRQPDNPIIFVNREFTYITGYEAADAIGRNPRFLQGPGTECEAAKVISQAVQTDSAICVELTNYRKSGEAFLMRIEVHPVYGEDGALVLYAATLSEVTRERQAGAALRASESRWRALIAAMPMALCEISRDGIVTAANGHAEHIFGFGPQGLIGRPTESLMAVPSDRAELIAQLNREGIVNDREMRIRRADGSLRWTLFSASKVHGPDDGSVVIFQDVSAQKQRQQELEESIAAAERMAKARMRFFAAASHDLRQPLQALALFTSALEGQEMTDSARMILSSMKSALGSMEDMFNGLLDVSRIDAGVLVPDRHVFQINDICERLEDEFQAVAKDAKLEMRMVPSSATIHSDPALLSRILRNFLANAVKYTGQGRILMGCRRHGGSLRIEVWDNGPGIPSDQLLTIFNEFYQSEGQGPSRKGGIGLGLAIVQRLARLLGHRLDVRSEVGRGTMFAVEVPLAEDGPPAKSSPDVASHDENAEESRKLAGAVVAVVEEEPAIRAALRLLLAEWGCQAVVEASGAALDVALHAIGQRPDVIIADRTLSGGEMGVHVIEGLRRRYHTDIPAFLFTGTSPQLPQERGSGITDFAAYPILRKPLAPLQLRKVLSQALAR